MKNTLWAMAGVLLAPFLFAEPAEAGDYCREYTKFIKIGNRLEQGYGKACQRPNGDWEIISSSPGMDPYEILPNDLRTQVVRQYVYYEPPPQRVVIVPAYNYKYVYHGPRNRAPAYRYGWNDRNDWHNDRRGWDNDHHDNGRDRGRDRH